MSSKTSAQINTCSNARWYVAQTRPNAEKCAIANLERQGYEIFCPRIVKTVRHARKMTRVLAPLFPGYVFVRRDISCEPWRSVNCSFGVVRLIASGDTPQSVPRGVVEALQARERGNSAKGPSDSLTVGKVVQIVGGPLADLVGTLEHLDASGRVRILLSVLGRSVSVSLRCAALLAVA